MWHLHQHSTFTSINPETVRCRFRMQVLLISAFTWLTTYSKDGNFRVTSYRSQGVRFRWSPPPSMMTMGPSSILILSPISPCTWVTLTNRLSFPRTCSVPSAFMSRISQRSIKLDATYIRKCFIGHLALFFPCPT